jgi:segregation and condensation protein B
MADETQDGETGTGEGESTALPVPDERLVAIVESVLFAAGEPLTLARLAETVPGPSRTELRAALRTLADRAGREGRGTRVVEVAAGYQLRTAPEYAQWVRRLFQQKPWRLTRATLETLAIIAYKQPITRAEIEAIRGVDADSVLASLLSRKLVRIVGRKDVVGRPLIYGTTRQFLEVFGLKDLGSLPALSEVAPTMPDGVAAGAAAADEEAASVDEDGARAEDHAPAEDPGGRRAVLAPEGGDADPGGAGTGERRAGDDARQPGTDD